MSIWNKILVGLNLLAAVVFFYMAARTLQTQKTWREKVIKLEKDIQEQAQKNEDIVHKKEYEGKLGILNAKFELHKLLVDRGPVWETTEKDYDAKTGHVKVGLDDACLPHGLSVKTIVQVFENRPSADTERGEYIGEFLVTDVAERMVELAPTVRLTKHEKDRIANNRGPWMIYLMMPADGHQVFERLADDEKKQLLPQGSVQEYLKDGQPAKADDLPENVRDGKYQRRLRDYASLFFNHRIDQTLYVDQRESLVRCAQYVTDGRNDAAEHEAFEQKYKGVLTKDQEVARAEARAVHNFVAQVQYKADFIKKQVAAKIEENLRLVRQIAETQKAAARRIDERTREVARVPGS